MTKGSRLPLLPLLAAAAGCPRPADVEVTIGSGAALGEYLVVAAREDGSVDQVLCPSGHGAGGVACTDGGAIVELAEGLVELTVKARGHSFATVALDVGGLPRSGDRRTAQVSLVTLAPFEDTADYATGFGEAGLDRFVSLAQSVDTDLGPTQVVKFYIADLGSSPVVYFQDTRAHPLHYEFAHEVLGLALSSAEFWQQTYRGTDRGAMAGTLVRYEKAACDSAALGMEASQPVAVTFFPSDDLLPEQALLAHRLVEERLGFAPLAGGLGRTAYVPAGSVQEEQLREKAGLFARRAAAWLTHGELWGGMEMQILNEGEAYGTLRYLSPEELETSVVSFGDVLLLSALPLELPIVGGTITEEFQTPLSHVNVAAVARGTPNVAWPGAASDPETAALIGQLVHMVAEDGELLLEETTLAEAQEFWDSRIPEIVELEADLSLSGLPAFADLGFDDAIRVGSKAANLAELHALLGDGSPDGFAVPFSHYDRFMRESIVDADLCESARLDCVEEGRDEVVCGDAASICLDGAGESFRDCSLRLMDMESFRSDSVLREALLDGLRHHIRNVPVAGDFALALDGRIVELFGDAPVRLRSSTNAEDLAGFSGAGMYSSTSAWGSGTEELASDEIRKVWASAWSWRAFEERSFWGLDHRTVYMGVAVHGAFGEEEANGVLLTQNVADPSVAGMYLNVQDGEVSVTNPEGGEVPEILSIVPGTGAGQVQVVRLCWSSLSPGVPILDQEEIQSLYETARQVQEHFAPLYGEDPYGMTLDIEFKLEGPERALVMKQVRPYLGS